MPTLQETVSNGWLSELSGSKHLGRSELYTRAESGLLQVQETISASELSKLFDCQFLG